MSSNAPPAVPIPPVPATPPTVPPAGEPAAETPPPPAVSAAVAALTGPAGTEQPDVDLTEPDAAVWLRAVLDQIDTAARAAAPGTWRVHQRNERWTVRAGIKPLAFTDEATAHHITNHNPTRVRGQVAAQRRIVNECSAALTGRRLYDGHGLPGMLATVILAELASQYRDWPGYQTAWSPW